MKNLLLVALAIVAIATITNKEDKPVIPFKTVA